MQNIPQRKILFIIGGGLLFLLAVLWVSHTYMISHTASTKLVSETSVSSVKSPSEEVSSGDQAKSQIASQPLASPSMTPEAKSSISSNIIPELTLIRSGQVNNLIQFKAYVSRVTDGTCVVIYSNGSNQVKQVGQVFREVTGTVDCVNTDVSIDRFPTSGTWEGSLVVTSAGISSAALMQSIQIYK